MLDELEDVGRRVGTEEAASILGVAVSTMAAWRNTNKGPRYQKLEGVYLYPEKWLIEYLRASEVNPAANRGVE